MARSTNDKLRPLVSPGARSSPSKHTARYPGDFEAIAPVRHLSTWNECRDALDELQPLQYRQEYFRDDDPETESSYFEVTEERDFPRWMFRGEKSHIFEIEPWIERVARERGCTIAEMEAAVLREFWARFRLYGTGLEQPNDRLGRLALMQHYGAPTRLLDFSFSAFVALFFAVVDRSKADGSQDNPPTKPTVWALDTWQIEDALRETAGEEPFEPPTCLDSAKRNREALHDLNRDLLGGRGSSTPCASIVIDAGANPRLDRQQGAFLFSGSTHPLRTSVLHMMKERSGWCQRFTIEPGIAEEVEARLHQMNIHHLTLFPDLHGLSHYSRRAGMLRLRPTPGPATQIK